MSSSSESENIEGGKTGQLWGRGGPLVEGLEKNMKITIDVPGGKMKLIVLRYGKGPGILWIHGGGYAMGMAAMVHAACTVQTMCRRMRVLHGQQTTTAYRRATPI